MYSSKMNQNYEENSPEEDNYEEEYEPTEEDIIAYAQFLGMDPELDREYLDIAYEGVKAPLPEGWVSTTNENGEYIFINVETQEVCLNHPLDDYYRQLFQEKKAHDLMMKQKIEKEKEMRKKTVKLDKIGGGSVNKLNKLQPISGSSDKKIKSNIDINYKQETTKIESREGKNMSLYNLNVPSNKNNTSNNLSNHSNGSEDQQKIQSLNNTSFIEDNKFILKSGNEINTPLKNRKIKSISTNQIDIDKEFEFNLNKYYNNKNKEINEIKTELKENYNTKKKNLNLKIRNIKEKSNNISSEIQNQKEEKKNEIKKKLEFEILEKYKEKIEKLKSIFESKKNEIEIKAKKQSKNLKNNLINEEILEKEILLKETKNKNEEILKESKENLEKVLKKNLEIKLNEFEKKLIENKNLRISNYKNKLLNQEILKNNEEIIDNCDTKKNQFKTIFEKKLNIERMKLENNLKEKIGYYERDEKYKIEEILKNFKNNFGELEFRDCEIQIINEEENIRRNNQIRIDIFKKQIEQEFDLKKMSDNIEKRNNFNRNKEILLNLNKENEELKIELHRLLLELELLKQKNSILNTTYKFEQNFDKNNKEIQNNNFRKKIREINLIIFKEKGNLSQEKENLNRKKDNLLKVKYNLSKFGFNSLEIEENSSLKKELKENLINNFKNCLSKLRIDLSSIKQYEFFIYKKMDLFNKIEFFQTKFLENNDKTNLDNLKSLLNEFQNLNENLIEDQEINSEYYREWEKYFLDTSEYFQEKKFSSPEKDIKNIQTARVSEKIKNRNISLNASSLKSNLYSNRSFGGINLNDGFSTSRLSKIRYESDFKSSFDNHLNWLSTMKNKLSKFENNKFVF